MHEQFLPVLVCAHFVLVVQRKDPSSANSPAEKQDCDLTSSDRGRLICRSNMEVQARPKSESFLVY